MRTLSTFPGMARTKGNQPKLLKKLTEIIFERVFLAQFTFSGKSVKGQRKNSFKQNVNIIALLYSVACEIDKSYDEDDFKAHLRDKILKYAGE